MTLKLPPPKKTVVSNTYGAICGLEHGESVEPPEMSEPSSTVLSGQGFLPILDHPVMPRLSIELWLPEPMCTCRDEWID